MAKKKERPPEEGAPAWMATFSDLMNLLLCFFVLLFASSTMDEGKIQKIAASFDNLAFSVISGGSISLLEGNMMSGGVVQAPDIEHVLSEAGKNIDGNTGDTMTATESDAEKLDDADLIREFEKRGEEQSEEMYDEVVQMTESYRIDDQVIIDYTAQYVQLDLNGSILFDSGSAKIKEDSKLFLQKIASILVKYKYCIIEIEGHTDNVPVSSGSRYADNRELSADRARSVYDYIMNQEIFIDSNVKIAGYGESKPVASNSTPEGRQRNRRVVIKIYNQQNSIN